MSAKSPGLEKKREDEEFEEVYDERKGEDEGKRHLKDLARMIWMAVEFGDKIKTLDLLQKTDRSTAQLCINCSNSDGWSPLHNASNEGHSSIVEILLEHGAIIDARAKGIHIFTHEFYF